MLRWTSSIDRTLAMLLAVVATGFVHCERQTAATRGESAVPGAAERIEAARRGEPGEQVEADIYKFTLEHAELCDTVKSEPARIVVGAKIRVESKIHGLYVRPEDARLRSGGFVFRSHVREEASEACTPLLRARRLDSAQSQSGFVLFELPASRAVDLALQYEPTRWGGADRVEVRFPEIAGLASPG